MNTKGVNEMTDVMTTSLYFDELKDYALRGLDQVKPGMEVLQIHVPSLGYPEFSFGRAVPNVVQKTVQEVRSASWSELHPGSTHQTLDAPMIFFKQDSREWSIGAPLDDYIFATDAGVIPYNLEKEGLPKFFNDSNFLVDVDELARVGIEPNLTTASPDYMARARVSNSKVRDIWTSILSNER